MSEFDDLTKNNQVGPVLTGGPIAEAAIEAAEIDNPDAEITVDDKGAYVRITCNGEMLLTARTMAEVLGHSFEISDLEINMGSFAGQIESHDDYMRFYFNKIL
jgi:toluene monooxygenase system protein D